MPVLRATLAAAVLLVCPPPPRRSRRGRRRGPLVLSLSGTRGNDPSGAQRVFGTVRAAGAPAFGPSEQVSDAAADASPVVFAAAGIDAAGRPLAAFEPLGGASSVAVRAGGP